MDAWTLPPGWQGRLSTSKGRWFFWHASNPSAVTWTAPSWNDTVAASYNENLRPDPASSLFRSCQNFCKSAVLNLWLFETLAPGSRVLDVVCGKGGDMAKIPTGLSLSWTGVDIAEDALGEARLRARRFFPDATFLKADFCKPLPVEPHSFDAAWSSFAFHYAGDALDSALRNIKTALKPGARFLFIVLDESVETRHPAGFGPLRIERWEHRDVGPNGTCASSTKCWVSFAGSFSSLPECILSKAQVEAACAAAKMTVICSLPLGDAANPLFDWALTPRQQEVRATLQRLRDAFKDSRMWDSTHFEFANCYRAWMVEA